MFAKSGETAVIMDRGLFQCFHAWDLPFGRVEYWRGTCKNGGALRYLSEEGDLERIDHFAHPGSALRAAIKVGCVVPGCASLGGSVAPAF